MIGKKVLLMAMGMMVAIALGTLTDLKGVAQTPTDLDLAAYHAPIHYQNTDSTKLRDRGYTSSHLPFAPSYSQKWINSSLVNINIKFSCNYLHFQCMRTLK
ncbi:hypothetical protein [Nostoc sp. FACHB-280]|uniref:hypothetical protein n=1 Tax=Nostoc sp. FACHB-280 TaxID=2692839 RepID=UPI00168A6706|nr:hypothetical protein [Nostoc sp. FACHB-280]MBD2496196.1 hypothetical protein [Nostoc sp. FACHB-280]